MTMLLVRPAAAEPPAPPPPATFSGLYLGIQTDYGFGGGGDWCLCTYAPLLADASGGDGGIVVGGHVGADLRLGPLVLEAETRLSYAEVDFAEECGVSLRCSAKLNWLAEAQLGAGV